MYAINHNSYHTLFLSGEVMGHNKINILMIYDLL